jgi:hypothetical protein
MNAQPEIVNVSLLRTSAFEPAFVVVFEVCALTDPPCGQSIVLAVVRKFDIS